MKIVWRAAVVLLVGVGLGVWTDHAVLRHSADGGLYEPQVRMGAAMAGLFGGGAAATLVLIAVLLLGRKASGELGSGRE